MTDLHDLNTRNDGKGEPRMERFFECYVEGTNGGKHFKHFFLSDASTEAERLARLPENRGKRVYLFECLGVCTVEPEPVKWRVPRLDSW